MSESARRPPLSRNLLSEIGLGTAVIGLANLVFLIYLDMSGTHSNPYFGILTWIVAPAILIFGLSVFFFGMLRERNRRRRTAPDEVALYPRVDLNERRTRLILGWTAVGLILFVTMSVVGSYQAYHYTESDAFCGTTCHQVMQPEYTAYQQSPHARVGCVSCHVGSGAGSFVKSKLNGAHQVYSLLTRKYPKPIPSPVENLRPAQQTCEQCHWPQKFFGTQLKVFDHYAYDEASTPREVRLLIKTGGGSPASGQTVGIHWHMNIANEVTYVAADKQRQVIPWVRIRNRKTGQVTEYKAEDSKLSDAQIAAASKRTMDCVDCHNRPTHIYRAPDASVDMALRAGRIDRSLPFIKQQAVTALAKDYPTTDAAIAGIRVDLEKYYRENYPALLTSKGDLCHTVLSENGANAAFEHPVDLGDLRAVTCSDCHTGGGM
jgi:nitrate/TMAO reductase-like tetraheme cytochrome c subunit